MNQGNNPLPPPFIYVERRGNKTVVVKSRTILLSDLAVCDVALDREVTGSIPANLSVLGILIEPLSGCDHKTYVNKFINYVSTIIMPFTGFNDARGSIK